MLKRRSQLSISAVTAGVIAVTVSYGGPAAIIFQAAEVGGLSDAQLSSWIFAFSVSTGLIAIVMSWRLRMPIITAWSSPGAALLLTAWPGYSYAESIGAFILAGVLMVIVGWTGWFARIVDRLPRPLIGAMLAGILFGFAVRSVEQLEQTPRLAIPMLAAYLIARRFVSRYAVVITVIVGIVAAAVSGLFTPVDVTLAPVQPIWTDPTFRVGSMIGLGLPLFLVTLVGQNVTGLGVLKASGYEPNGNRLVTVTGAMSTLGAPFGSHGVNLAAITAAICTGESCHPDRDSRWVAGVTNGSLYVLIGIFGATFVSLVGALPSALIAIVAGLALLGAIGSGLTQAMEDPELREPALLTFLITASGITMLSVGSAAWGLIIGAAAAWLTGWRKRDE